MSVKADGCPAVKNYSNSKLEFYNRLNKYSLIKSKIRKTQHVTEKKSCTILFILLVQHVSVYTRGHRNVILQNIHEGILLLGRDLHFRNNVYYILF